MLRNLWQMWKWNYTQTSLYPIHYNVQSHSDTYALIVKIVVWNNCFLWYSQNLPPFSFISHTDAKSSHTLYTLFPFAYLFISEQLRKLIHWNNIFQYYLYNDIHLSSRQIADLPFWFSIFCKIKILHWKSRIKKCKPVRMHWTYRQVDDHFIGWHITVVIISSSSKRFLLPSWLDKISSF